MVNMNGWLILLVDDEEVSMEATVIALEMEGAAVVQVTDGTEALRYLRNHKLSQPDLIILDIMMNEGDEIETDDEGRSTGVEVYEKIRSELKLTTPMVVSTVVSDERILSRFPDERRDSRMTVIHKPYRFRELLAAIERVTGGKVK